MEKIYKKEEFNLIPYKSVGLIKFGMSKQDVIDVFEKEPDFTSILFSKRTELQWGTISVRLNKKEVVDEISFLSDSSVFYNDLDILNNPKAIKELTKKEKPYNTVGFKVFFELGIAVTGFSKNKEERTLSVFSKELIKGWKE